MQDLLPQQRYNPYSLPPAKIKANLSRLTTKESDLQHTLECLQSLQKISHPYKLGSFKYVQTEKELYTAV